MDPKHDHQQKQLRLMQLQTAVLVCILVLLLAAGLYLAAQLSALDDCLALVEP